MPPRTPYAVLNVDDNDAARYARYKVLARAGYQVLDARTGSEALTVARKQRPALIVLDIQLPDLSGYDVCQQIKRDPLTAAILVLQISAIHTSYADRAAGLESADWYLTEPVAASDFLATVEALLRLHAREQDYQRLLRDVRTAGLDQSMVPASSLTEAQQQVRRLTAQLGAVKEHEREKLAQSLHDDLAQLLVVARMKLHQQRRLSTAEQSVEEIDAVLDQCLTYTRSAMSDLLPPELSDGRLDLALQWLADPMRAHGLTMVVEVPPSPVVLPEHTAMTIVKCVRELLFNVLKHAGTGEAFVTLSMDQGMVQVTVQDHGKGYKSSPAEASAPHGFGLASVHQRLAMLNGRLIITSQPDMGTQATVIVPHRPPSTT